MRTFSIVKGLPVFELKSGSKIGEVCDFSIANGRVKGLLLKKGALLKKTYFIDIHDVSSFGWNGVMLKDPKALKRIKRVEDYTFDGHNRLNRRMMLTSSGDQLGLLEDVYFLEEMGTIVGYELSDGFFSDVTEGKRVIKTNQPPAIGKDAIIVHLPNDEKRKQ
ncbi:PRC-barrel domain-containing protein [Cytobacillus spongiae]|uniref:PRC-barrel domain-containing protein n=1 Tax=Cytobacillus spongiae TaxID=2901381 RepID=UPI001F24BA41|nr:PRC-barrel domain-containing protein [Cytobacillus spongiae]UII54982.1 PRC-barrel domain-containing protein [Cytobacillus spongiae]